MRSAREKRIIRQRAISIVLGISLLIGAIYIYITFQPGLFSGIEWVSGMVEKALNPDQ